jgi:hypothetical protein
VACAHGFGLTMGIVWGRAEPSGWVLGRQSVGIPDASSPAGRRSYSDCPLQSFNHIATLHKRSTMRDTIAFYSRAQMLAPYTYTYTTNSHRIFRPRPTRQLLSA